MEPEVLIMFGVARTIIRNSAKFDVETGGILAGTLANPIAIIAAGLPGNNAIHHAASFTSDPQADRDCLDKARKFYSNKISLVGWWHKHPPGLITPSSGDCHQAQRLANDYNDGKPVLIGIVNQHRGIITRKTTLHLYSIDPAGKLYEYNWKLVTNKSRKLLDAIVTAPTIPDLKSTDFWSDRDFQSYLNPVGRDRIKQEIDGLRKHGWQVQISRRKLDNLLVLDITRYSNALRFLMPPEFPLNPPTITTGDGKQFTGLKTLSQWNSLCCLVDTANEAIAVINCNCCSKQYIEDKENVTSLIRSKQ